jgi:hypothetical protein
MNAADQTQSIAVLVLDGEIIVKASEEKNVRGLTCLDALDTLTFALSFDGTVFWFELGNDGSIAKIGAFEVDASHPWSPWSTKCRVIVRTGQAAKGTPSNTTRPISWHRNPQEMSTNSRIRQTAEAPPAPAPGTAETQIPQ